MDRIQRYKQRLLQNAVRETRLITAVDVAAGRRIRVTSATWDEYWGQCGPFATEIGQLKAAWTALIAKNFASNLRREFVRAYFRLLRTCLDGHACGQDALVVLRKIVRFETIRVSGDCGGSAAAIVSARHPVYLLGKLARPDAPENPKYLPLICPCDIALLLRACNLFSRFSIEKMSYREANALIGQTTSCEPLDSQVLRPAELIESNRLGRIQHGIGRVVFKNGRLFRQFSSSDYFKAIQVVMGETLPAEEDTVYAPLRVFDDTVLVLPSGRSLIGQLLTMANHLVIEDADLLPCQLEHHFQQFALGHLSVTDLTDRAKRRGLPCISLSGNHRDDKANARMRWASVFVERCATQYDFVQTPRAFTHKNFRCRESGL